MNNHNERKCVTTEIKVRFNECDPYSIAHNSNYYIWFEIGRFDYAEENGYNIRNLMVLRTRCKYIRSCKFNDTLIVRTRMKNPLSVFPQCTFEQEIYNKVTGELIAKCWTENTANTNLDSVL